jgi:hypothetical protein
MGIKNSIVVYSSHGQSSVQCQCLFCRNFRVADLFLTNFSYSTEFHILTSICSTARPLFKLFLGKSRMTKNFIWGRGCQCGCKEYQPRVSKHANGVDSGQTWFVMFENNLKINVFRQKSYLHQLLVPFGAFGSILNEWRC